MQVGLGITSTVTAVIIIVLLVVVTYQLPSTPLLNTTALVQIPALFLDMQLTMLKCLCGMQRTAILGQVLVVDFEAIQKLSRTITNIFHSAVKGWLHRESLPESYSETRRRTDSDLRL